MTVTSNLRLKVDKDGRVVPEVKGGAVIQHNTPWPCVNGTPGGGASKMMGVVMHTEVGYEGGTIKWFNDPAAQASAFFAIGKNGVIHQFGPIGKNWMAWTQSAGNPMWYGIEDADNTHPSVPLTDAQAKAFAQVLECLSTFDGFPLRVTNSVNREGLGVHSMGGVPWGDHLECPGPVRAAQRHGIVETAKEIRAWTPTPPVYKNKAITADGTMSLRQIAASFKNGPASVIWRTLRTVPWQKHLMGYIARGNWSAAVPAGVVLIVRAAVTS